MTVTTVEPVDNDDESYDGEDDELEVLGEDVKDIEDENDNEQHASEIIIPEKETLTKKKKFKRKMRRVSRRFGMREVADDEDWMLYWTDFSVSLDRVMEMKKYQKINHFPGMAEICRKDLLARNLNRLHKLFPKDYNIFPRSWCLPADYGDFQAYARTKKNKSYISKPASGSQGHGIWVTKSFNQVKSGEHMVLQQYISKPLLLDGFKFDLRLYVLITSCDPLRLYLYEEGMVRLATIKYSEPTNSNLDEQCMHLTNYAINKHSSDFIRDDISGSKRRFSATLEVLEERGIDIDKLHHDICDVIIKTFISAHPILKHNYRTCFTHHIKGSACFEILGFDILLDRKCRPYVIEVNHSPSFTTDAPFDKELKEGLIMDALNMLNFSVADRRKCVDEEKRRIRERLMNRTRPKEKVNTETPVGNLKEEHDEFSEANIRKNMDDWELNHNGMYRLIYPTEENKTAYDRFFEHSGTLFGETAASKARGECARQLRDEIQQKQDKLLALSRGTKPRDRSLTRPESPGSTKRIFNRPKSKRNIPIKTKPQNSEGVFRATVRDDVNTMQPQPISDSEEMERLNSLLIRDNLLRAMGVVEQVYRLLQPSLDGKPTENGKERYFSGISKPPVPAYVSMSTLNKPTKAYLSQMNQRSILLQRYNSRSQLADALDIDVEDDKRPRASSAHNRSKDQANVQPYLNVVAHPAPMIQNGNFNVVHVPLNRREPFARGASFIFVSNLLNPILLIPGDGGTRLDAKLNLSKTPHIFCFKDLDWFIAWVNIPLVILPLEVDCMVAILKLEYNATSHTTSNPDGVEIKWGQPGTLKGISTLDEFGFIVYYRDMIEDLADVGYQPGVNIQGLPFDWRKAGNELTDSINSMIQLIESLYEKTNNSVIIVSHSMGGFVVLQMLQQQTKLWKDKYIKCVVAVATPYYGAIKAIQATISGYDLDSRFIPAEKLKYALRTYPSTAWLFPNTKFWDNKDTLVFTPSKNYTYNDYKELYADLNFKQGYKMYLDTFSLLTLEPPGVEWHTLYGENLSTPYRLRYGKDFPNDQPNIDSVSGDGTVNVFSSTGSKYWINKQKEKLEFHAINKVEHVDLISNREVIEYVKKVANVL